MKKTSIKISLPPQIALDPFELKAYIQSKYPQKVHSYLVRKRSIDARKAPVKVHLQLDLIDDKKAAIEFTYKEQLGSVHNGPPVLIVGSGPAGLFAALRLIERGLKPIILERGKDVRARRRDLASINKHHKVNADSNYCFGEGGAGTYSDGKLYTRAKKRGDWIKILQILIEHGAPPDIMIDAHPHIGTNKLPKVVENIRKSILNAGGEILFETAITNLIVEQGRILGVKDRSGQKYRARAVILATGHSARDVYSMLHAQNIRVLLKPFAIGFRVEHPQDLIDSIQYHRQPRGLLPAASYSITHKITGEPGRGVFSFCMCPGGFIVPAATNPGEVVVNGMSPSRRDSKFANSGIVISVTEKDFNEFSKYGPLAGMYFQQNLEKQACALAGGDQTVPAQRLMDFLNSVVSVNIPATSYQPGVSSQNLVGLLPKPLELGIKQALKVFGKQMRGYLTNEAVLMAVESRTSAPVKIPRDNLTLQHPQVEGLFPCGEGAGYAGGIMSAALDGIRCANGVAVLYKTK